MKAYSSISLVLVLGVLIGCKKDNTSEKLIASLADKTWAGTMTYTGQDAEYFSVHFDQDNSFFWCELSGDYSGTWQLTDNQLTMSFDGSGVEIKSKVNVGKLSNFSVKNTSSYKINACAPVKDPDPTLDNTIWEGAIENIFIGTEPAERYVMNFKPGKQVVLDIGSGGAMGSYQRLKSGGGVRANFGGVRFIGVVTGSNEMKGSYLKPLYSWRASKK